MEKRLIEINKIEKMRKERQQKKLTRMKQNEDQNRIVMFKS